MNRKMEFRGKDVESDRWIYGYYYRGELEPDKAFIICKDSYDEYEVIPETIGQFTDLHDKNKKEYCHKDLFRHMGNIYCVEYNFGGYGFYAKNQKWEWLYFVSNTSEIIGNVYDNPESKDNRNDSKIKTDTI